MDNVKFEKNSKLTDVMSVDEIEYFKLTLLKPNPILLELNGKNTFQLWENEEEKHLVLKYIYDFCEGCYYNNTKIVRFASWLGVKAFSHIEKYAKQYAIEYLGYNEETWNIKRGEQGVLSLNYIYKNRKNQTKIVYDKLLEVDSLDDIISIIDNSGCNVQTLTYEISNYVIVHRDNDKDLIDKLKSKFKLYSDYKANQKNELKQQEKDALMKLQKSILIPKAIEIVRKFINDESSNKIDDFCQKNNIDRNIFSYYVLLVKEIDDELYSLYSEKIDKFKKLGYVKIVGHIEIIVKGLKNGVEENGIIRPFDLIDYFLVSNYSFQDILKLSKSIISRSDYILLRKFIEKNNSGEKNNTNVINQIMSEKVVISYQKDKKGSPIPGTEEIFSNEDKEKLINYLRKNNIPINLKTYGIIFRRYRNGTLDIELETPEVISSKKR